MHAGVVLGFEELVETARSVPTDVLYAGIDPGLRGFAVVISGDGARVVEAHPAPIIGDVLDPRGMFDLARSWTGRVGLVLIERQQAMPDQGGVSNFTTGFGYGLWIMALTAAGVPFETAHPATWKGSLGLLPPPRKGASKLPKKEQVKHRAARRLESKARAIARVLSLFPGYDLRPSDRARVPSADKAEATLLATLARRSARG